VIEQTQPNLYKNLMLENKSLEINDIYRVKNFYEKNDKMTVVKSNKDLIFNINNDIHERFEYYMYSRDSKCVQQATLGLTETFLSPFVGGGINMQGEKAFSCTNIYLHTNMG
jgi:hypothetical protein